MKKLLLIAFSLVSLLIVAQSAHAVFWACFDKGQPIDFCGLVQDRQASVDGQAFCVSSFNDVDDCWNYSPHNNCNALPPDQQGCVDADQNGTVSIDSKPPEITLTTPNPDNTSLFDKLSVEVQLHVDERSHVYYRELGADRWTRICNDCTGDIEKTIRFDEGENNIEFKAEDLIGNAAETSAKFFIDSKDPRISKTEPKRGFANGRFYVEFEEDNVDVLSLTYGNSFVDHVIDHENACHEARRGLACEVEVDLSPWDGGDISYWFNLTDIVGNKVTSRAVTLPVDISAPVLNSIEHHVEKKTAFFTLNVTEANLDKILYIDLNDPKGRWKTLCSRLKDGLCEGKASFSDGLHSVLLNLTDEAGNYVEHQVTPDFYTDSKKPKFKKTEPRRGFANGDFYVEFDEANPTQLDLFYGNELTGFASENVALGGCELGRRGYSCNVNGLDMSPYHGQEIEYWFNLTDVLDQEVESRHTKLDVDTVDPVINDWSFAIDGRRVAFFFNVTEDNFDVIEYVNLEDANPRARTLCSRLSEGICEKTLLLRTGTHDLSITVWDDAGNGVAVSTGQIVI